MPLIKMMNMIKAGHGDMDKDSNMVLIRANMNRRAPAIREFVAAGVASTKIVNV